MEFSINKTRPVTIATHIKHAKINFTDLFILMYAYFTSKI